MRRDDIRRLQEEYGPRQFVQLVCDVLEGDKLPNGTELKMKDSEFSLRALWEGLVGPVEETLPSKRASALYVDMREEVNTSSFVAVTKLLLANRVIEGYNMQRGIGDQLVSTMNSTRRLENVAGFTSVAGLLEVKESEAYLDSGIEDKYVTTEAIKKGRIISISEEAIMEDQTGQLLVRAQRIGEAAAQEREKTIIHGVIDLNSNVYRPSGVPTALYSGDTGHKNLIGDGTSPAGWTTAIALEDWTDLQEVLQYHAEEVSTDRQIGDNEPILWNPNILLVPPALEGTGMRIVNATTVESTATNQRTVFNNPMARRFTVLSSPYIPRSGITGADADWYLGEFSRQFFWQEIWPIQVFRQDANSESAFAADLVARFKVRYLGGIFSADHRLVMKVKGS